MPIFTDRFLDYHSEWEKDFEALKTSVTSLRRQHSTLQTTERTLVDQIQAQEEQRALLKEKAAHLNHYLQQVSLQLQPVVQRMVRHWSPLQQLQLPGANDETAATTTTTTTMTNNTANDTQEQVYATLMGIMGVLTKC